MKKYRLITSCRFFLYMVLLLRSLLTYFLNYKKKREIEVVDICWKTREKLIFNCKDQAQRAKPDVNEPMAVLGRFQAVFKVSIQWKVWLNKIKAHNLNNQFQKT